MSVDEDRVAEEFAAIVVDVPVDVDAVMTRGHRLRRRRLLDGLSALAVLVLVVAVSVTLVVTAPRATPAQPGVPTVGATDGTQATFVPTTVATDGTQTTLVPTTAHPSVPTTGATSGTQTVSMKGLPTYDGPVWMRVTASRSKGTIRVRVDTNAHVDREAAYPAEFSQPDDGAFVPHRVHGELVVAVAPAGTKLLEVVLAPGSDAPDMSKAEYLDKVGLWIYVYAFWGEDAAANIRGFLYEPPGGVTVRDTVGGTVARACAVLRSDVVGEHRFCAYEAPALDLFSVSDNGSYTNVELSMLPRSGSILDGLLSSGGTSGESTTVSFAVLPAGASGITVETGGRGLKRAWGAWVLHGSTRDYVVVGVAVRAPHSKPDSNSSNSLTYVTYTNAAGERVQLPSGFVLPTATPT